MNPEPYVTTREVAEVLGVSTETVLRWWRAGRLPGRRLLGSQVLRFRWSEIEAALDGAERDSQAPGLMDAASVGASPGGRRS